MSTTCRRTVSRFESSTSSQMLLKDTPSTLAIIMYGDPTPPIHCYAMMNDMRYRDTRISPHVLHRIVETSLDNGYANISEFLAVPLQVGTRREQQNKPCGYYHTCEGNAQHCNLPKIDYPSDSQKCREAYMRWKQLSIVNISHF